MTPAVRRLWRRVGLGGGPDRLRHAGLEETLEFLLSYPTRPDPLPGPPPFPRLPPGIVPTLLLLGESVAWWLERMARTDRPLEEWLTLFWHRHFATSASKVFSPGLMLAQNQTLRRCGGGRFGELLWEIVNDPAMVIWLDLNQSPNENFARELLELYTVGPGHYSEADIKSLARVFTGWGLDFPSLTTRFRPERHEDGPVKIMQIRGQRSPREVMEALAVHPATARRLTERLWRALTGEPPSRDWSDLWVRTRGDVLAVLRAMLRSPELLVCPPRVQSPVELYVACLRLLEVGQVPLEHVRRLYQMGECPFLPPGVKGWSEGWDWIHPTAMLERFALLWDVVERLPESHPCLLELQALPEGARARAALRLAEGWEISPSLPDELRRHQGAPRRLLGVLLCSPDFQVN